MMKVLLATTAIATISLAGTGYAQESDMMTAGGNTLNIGGYYEFGFASFSDDLNIEGDGADSYSYGDSELFIDFETTTDAGMTYGVQIDLPLVNGSRHVESGPASNAEESSIYINDEWGEVHLGHDDNAYGRFQIWVPTYDGATSQDDNVIGVKRLPLGDGTIDAVLAHSAAGQGQAYEDNAKAVYISPDFSGFQFGVSSADAPTANSNSTSFGASYKADFSGAHRWLSDALLTLKGSAWKSNGTGDEAADEEEHTHLGASFDLSKWTFTYARYKGKGAYEELRAADGTSAPVENATNNAPVSGTAELEAAEYGIGYDVNDAFSVGASHASATTDVRIGGDVGEFEGEFQTISGIYTVAPGLTSTLSYNQFEISANSDQGLVRIPDDETENTGTEIVWQIEFSF